MAFLTLAVLALCQLKRFKVERVFFLYTVTFGFVFIKSLRAGALIFVI